MTDCEGRRGFRSWSWATRKMGCCHAQAEPLFPRKILTDMLPWAEYPTTAPPGILRSQYAELKGENPTVQDAKAWMPQAKKTEKANR